MKMKTSQVIKYAAMLVLAFAVVLTTVLVPVSAKAANQSEGFIVASYTMAKGEKWTLVVHNVDDKVKPSFKSNKKSVATVNNKGIITAKKPGTAVITATWKEGKTTYTAKTKIKVKKSITYAEAVKRVNAELNLLYVYAYDLAEANGWMDDSDAVEYLTQCAEVVNTANAVVKDTDSYSDDEIASVLEAIATMAETMDDVLPVLAQPSK